MISGSADVEISGDFNSTNSTAPEEYYWDDDSEKCIKIGEQDDDADDQDSCDENQNLTIADLRKANFKASLPENNGREKKN